MRVCVIRTFLGTVCLLKRRPVATIWKDNRLRGSLVPTAHPPTRRSLGLPLIVSTCFVAVADVAGPTLGTAVAVAEWSPTTERKRPNDNGTPTLASDMKNTDRPTVRKIPARSDQNVNYL